jgi:Fungal N-terminal domain of STAND proteins
MAEVIGIASAAVQLVGFAWTSSKALRRTIESFKSSKRAVRELKNELESLEPILKSLTDVAKGNEKAFDSLRLPVFYCGTACEQFNDFIEKCAPHAAEDRRSFRDWISLRWRGDDLDEFRKTLSIYKATINIAIGDVNL